MSDEKDSGTQEWRIDSLEEEDDIIDLTDEVTPPQETDTAGESLLDEETIDIEELETSAIEEDLLEFPEASENETLFEDLPALGGMETDTTDNKAEIDPADEVGTGPFDKAAPAGNETGLHGDLKAGPGDSPPLPDDDIIEISEFDQEYFTEDEVAAATAGLTAVPKDDDFLELIDVESPDEDAVELDDDIIRFDNEEADSEPIVFDEVLADPGDFETEDASSASFGSDTPTAGLQSPMPEEAVAEVPDDDWLIDAAGPAATDETAGTLDFAAAPGFAFDSADGVDAGQGPAANGESAEWDGVDASQIEAAVAKIIERDYAEKIEGLVAAAIEKVVTREIERLKSRLFEEGDDDTRYL